MNWHEDEDTDGGFLSCKEGKTLKVKVKSMEKVVGDTFSKFNYKRRDGSPVLTEKERKPFHHVLTAENDKVLTIGALSLMGALKKSKVDAGDEIEISHPGRGKYEVKVLNRDVNAVESEGQQAQEEAISMDDIPTTTPF